MPDKYIGMNRQQFVKEMELYQDALSDEEKAQMQKVLDAFGMES